MTIETELEHLHSKTYLTEHPGLLAQFLINCDNNALEVLEKIKVVLIKVLENSRGQWPSNQEWMQLLPSWFIDKFAPEKSKEEQEAWTVWWRQLPWKEQARIEEEKKWTLIGWISWFTPDDRPWYWWNAWIVNEDTFIVQIEVEGSPFASGALQWLMKACGATHIEEA